MATTTRTVHASRELEQARRTEQGGKDDCFECWGQKQQAWAQLIRQSRPKCPLESLLCPDLVVTVSPYIP